MRYLRPGWQHNGLATISQWLAALRYFNPAFVRSGSKSEAAFFGFMSASASCGHSLALHIRAPVGFFSPTELLDLVLTTAFLVVGVVISFALAWGR
jgi:hypothetical protein